MNDNNVDEAIEQALRDLSLKGVPAERTANGLMIFVGPYEDVPVAGSTIGVWHSAYSITAAQGSWEVDHVGWFKDVETFSTISAACDFVLAAISRAT